MKEMTLKDNIKISGVGVHMGVISTIYLHPEEKGGIRFIKNEIVIPAKEDSIFETERGIVLSGGSEKIYTVEHLLAALFSCGIDHLTIEVKGKEIPALNGSAFPFIKAMEAVGFVNLPEEKDNRYIQNSYSVEGRGCFAYARPADRLEISYVISYDHPLLSYQEYRYNGKSNFKMEIARARTYGLLSWKEELQASGYALAASSENTLIYDQKGILNNPRFPDEAVRHKILDFSGDLYLFRPIFIGSYFISRGGHRLHIELLKKIKRSES